MRYWQDIQVGEIFETDSRTLTREEIVEFAAEFDPQPYHLDTDVAESSIFGGLCASGWQVSALMMRLLTDAFKQQEIMLMGVSRVGHMRWKKPVFAGDRLVAKITIVDAKPESNLPGQGSIDCDVLVHNQDGKMVINLSTTLLLTKGQGPDHAH